MILSDKLVQVARRTTDHSLLQGELGTAWWLGIMFPDLYVLAPEGADDEEKLKGQLCHESELDQPPSSPVGELVKEKLTISASFYEPVPAAGHCLAPRRSRCLTP